MDIFIFDTDRRLSAIIAPCLTSLRSGHARRQSCLLSSEKTCDVANKKQLVRNQQEESSSEKLFSENKNWFCQQSIKSWRTKKKFHKPVNKYTDQKLQAGRFPVSIHFYKIIKNRGPGPYNSLRHADNRKYSSGFFLTWNRGEAHVFYLVREVGKIWRCSRW